MISPSGAATPPVRERPAIDVVGLTKRFGGELAVDDVTFAVPAGRVTGFLGPNGAGKSTTMRMLIGLTQPTAGRATILGAPYGDLEHPALTVGALVDGIDFHPGRRAIDELSVNATAAGIGRDRCLEVLDLVGLGDAARQRIGGYSLGMRQRLGLAAALLGDPQVLILDEPANGLDPEGIQWTREFLRWLAGQGRTVFVSSHLLHEIARVADEVVVIHRGRIVAHAPVPELTAAAGAGGLVVRSLDPDRLAGALEGFGEITRDGDALTVTGATAEDVGRVALDAAVVLTELRPLQADLESVFFALTREERA